MKVYPRYQMTGPKIFKVLFLDKHLKIFQFKNNDLVKKNNVGMVTRVWFFS